jgi:uncharacterized membrane protein
MRDGRPYQFSTRRLLLLSTALAVTFAMARWVARPMIAQIGISIYFGVLSFWAVMRLPEIWHNILDIREQRREFAERRQALLAELTERKRAISAPNGGFDSVDHPKTD